MLLQADAVKQIMEGEVFSSQSSDQENLPKERSARLTEHSTLISRKKMMMKKK